MDAWRHDKWATEGGDIDGYSIKWATLSALSDVFGIGETGKTSYNGQAKQVPSDYVTEIWDSTTAWSGAKYYLLPIVCLQKIYGPKAGDLNTYRIAHSQDPVPTQSPSFTCTPTISQTEKPPIPHTPTESPTASATETPTEYSDCSLLGYHWKEIRDITSDPCRRPGTVNITYSFIKEGTYNTPKKQFVTLQEYEKTEWQYSPTPFPPTPTASPGTVTPGPRPADRMVTHGEFIQDIEEAFEEWKKGFEYLYPVLSSHLPLLSCGLYGRHVLQILFFLLSHWSESYLA